MDHLAAVLNQSMLTPEPRLGLTRKTRQGIPDRKQSPDSLMMRYLAKRQLTYVGLRVCWGPVSGTTTGPVLQLRTQDSWLRRPASAEVLVLDVYPAVTVSSLFCG